MIPTLIQNTDELRAPIKLEFDERERIVLTIEDLVNLELVRTGRLKLNPKGYSRTHFADYQLENCTGIITGHFFYYAPGLGKIMASQIPFEIMPGSNRLEVIVYNINMPDDKRHFLYEFQVDGRVYQNGGPVFIMEDYAKNYSNDFLDRMSQLALMFESRVGNPKNISRIKLTTNRFGASEHYDGSNVEIAHSQNIPGKCDEIFVEKLLMHEGAHHFYKQLNEATQLPKLGEFEYFYGQNFNDFGKKRFVGRFAGETEWTYDEGCVMAIFMEGHYKDENPGVGHPWDDAQELFASATSLMRCHTDELIKKIEQLPTQPEIQLAKQIMSKVIGLYREYGRIEAGLFPKEILAITL